MPAAVKPDVKLSGKEIAGLAVRVAGTALMPFGARGGAGEAVEFLELCEGSGLARLEQEMQRFTPDLWRAPQVVVETGDAAVTDAGGASALYFSLALADWVAAMVREHGHALVAVRRPSHSHYLHALPYWLASRGFTCLAATGDGTGNASEAAALSIASGDAGTWWYEKRSAIPAGLAALTPQALAARDPGELQAVASRLMLWLHQHRTVPALFAQPEPKSARGAAASFALVIASEQPIARALQGFPARTGDGATVTLTSGDWTAKKAACLAQGWPVDRELWESLMRFGDLSLVPTSEESRAGAG